MQDEGCVGVGLGLAGVGGGQIDAAGQQRLGGLCADADAGEAEVEVDTPGIPEDGVHPHQGGETPLDVDLDMNDLRLRAKLCIGDLAHLDAPVHDGDVLLHRAQSAGDQHHAQPLLFLRGGRRFREAGEDRGVLAAPRLDRDVVPGNHGTQPFDLVQSHVRLHDPEERAGLGHAAPRFLEIHGHLGVAMVVGKDHLVYCADLDPPVFQERFTWLKLGRVLEEDGDGGPFLDGLVVDEVAGHDGRHYRDDPEEPGLPVFVDLRLREVAGRTFRR